MNTKIQTESLNHFLNFISGEFGLYFPEEKTDELIRRLIKITDELGYNHPDDCIDTLLKTPVNQRIIDVLVTNLTIGETYFYRDRNVINTIEKIILPDLIQQKRSKGKCLRIWSAGCSTGEEAYTLAILLHKLIPDIRDWNIQILGTDINTAALDQAQRGVYTEWSFRGVSENIKNTYFHRKNDKEYELISLVKDLVSFSYLNLAKDSFPTLVSNTNAMDIVLCRNVLMYFTDCWKKKIIQKIYNSILENGWVISSPSEASANLFHDFSAVHFPNAILYQKTSPSKSSVGIRYNMTGETSDKKIDLKKKKVEFNERRKSCETRVSAKKQPEIPNGNLYGELLNLYKEGLYKEVITRIKSVDPKGTETADVQALISKAYANLGDLAHALNRCKQAIKHDNLRRDLHFLLATILQEQGEVKKAISALHQTIYLDPHFELSYFTLATILQQIGKTDEARKQFFNALSILDKKDPETILVDSEGMTAGRLSKIIKTILQASEYKKDII